jgi:HEPN domain-containing protein
MNEENELKLWIEHAEDDFNAARKLIRGKSPSLYSTCFHTQQCAEKYMKALLVLK